MDNARNKVVCPECGKVRLETPPGTTLLPTLGMALKASGQAGKCGCGRQPHERPGAVATAGAHQSDLPPEVSPEVSPDISPDFSPSHSSGS